MRRVLALLRRRETPTPPDVSGWSIARLEEGMREITRQLKWDVWPAERQRAMYAARTAMQAELARRL